MEVFAHHIYEFKKGLRNLILHTTHKAMKEKIIIRLEKEKIPYLIYPVGENNINILFGEAKCIDVIKSFKKQSLNDYTDEEDYILGIMLGYDCIKQCERYLKRKLKEKSFAEKLLTG